MTANANKNALCRQILSFFGLLDFGVSPREKTNTGSARKVTKTASVKKKRYVGSKLNVKQYKLPLQKMQHEHVGLGSWGEVH